jgi:hypothetical protein
MTFTPEAPTPEQDAVLVTTYRQEASLNVTYSANFAAPSAD